MLSWFETLKSYIATNKQLRERVAELEKDRGQVLDMYWKEHNKLAKCLEKLKE